MSSSSDSEPFFWGAVMAGFGAFSFFTGFTKLRKKRMIENIPTSKIRGMAMGTVEIEAKIKPYKKILISPLTQTPCVYYEYKIQEKRGSGKNSHWVTVSSGNSRSIPFIIDDQSGKVLVNPKKAEFHIPKDFNVMGIRNLGKKQEMIKEFMRKNGIHFESKIFGLSVYGTYSFEESFITEDEDIYVIGYAGKNPKFDEEHKISLYKRLGEVKKDPEKMKAIDTDGDGKISMEEWDIAVKNVEKDLIEEQLESSDSHEHSDIVISYNKNSDIFIISDHSQQTLLKKMFWGVILQIWGGAILAVLGVLVMVTTFKYLFK